MNQSSMWSTARIERRIARSLPAVLLCAPRLSAQLSPVRLDTIAVVASRTRRAAQTRSVDVITRADIARSAAHNVAEVLSTVMGVDIYTRSTAQADVSIRGSSPEQVVVLVDGVRMTDVQSAHYTLDVAVPLRSVERIEVLRGVGSALYGPDAVGGVIDIVTTRAGASELQARSGSFGSIGAGIASSGRRGALSVTGAADFDKSDGHRDGTDYRIGQARGLLTVPTPSGAIRTNVGLGIRDFGAADFYAPYNSIERTIASTLDTRWDASAGAWSLALAASTRRHHDHYVLVRGNPSLYENRHESWETGGNVTVKRDAGPFALAFGAEGAHDQLSSARLGGRREWRTGVFGEASMGGGGRTTAQTSARADHSSAYGDFVSPAAAVAVRVSDHARLHASGGLGFRAPTWTERFYTDPSNRGNADLRPERFWTADGGMRGAAGPWAVDVTGFTRRATNLIDWVKPAGASQSVAWESMNVGAATYRGVEAALELPSMRTLTASLYVDGLSFDVRAKTSIVGKYALRPITRQAGLRLSTADEHALTAHADLSLARRARERGYVTGNARLAWTRAAYRVTLDVMNLTDADWLDASGKRAARRGVYGGFAWKR